MCCCKSYDHRGIAISDTTKLILKLKEENEFLMVTEVKVGLGVERIK